MKSAGLLSPKKTIFLLLFFVLVFTGKTVLKSQENWYALFFTTPPEYNSKANPEAALVKLFRYADQTLDLALFDIDSSEITEGLISAAKRGVVVRLVTDDSMTGSEVISKLEKNGIGVRGDQRSAFMHNKFVIVDGIYVFTGSYNATENGARKNNNNAILIRSSELADIYGYEFKEMYEYGIFGNRKEQKKFALPQNHYYVKVGDADINAYFAPENNIEDILIRRIKKAKSSVLFMAFSFTSDKLGDAVVEAADRGVKVSGIFEARGASTSYSEYSKLKSAGIRVIKDKNRYIMHHKVIIIDEETVITGSYNFTKNAARKNDENVLIIKDKTLAQKYVMEFVRLYR